MEIEDRGASFPTLISMSPLEDISHEVVDKSRYPEFMKVEVTLTFAQGIATYRVFEITDTKMRCELVGWTRNRFKTADA